MTGTGVLTAVERRGRRTGVALGGVVILMLLVGPAVQAAEVLNPGFETTYMGTPFPRLLPQNWSHVDHASFNSNCNNSWTTEGTLSAALVSRMNKLVNPGDYQSFFQYVDLTGIGTIKFDVRLTAQPSGAFEHFEASFLVDGIALWTQNVAGVHLDQQVNVSARTGYHCIEMRITAVESGTFTQAAYWTQWDNVRLIERPKVVPATITLDPDTLYLHCPGKWIVGYIELPAGYDVNDIDEATVTLQDVPAYQGNEGWGKPSCNKSKIVDHDGNGLKERIVRFDLDAVQAIVQPPEAIVTVKGNLADKTPFEGAATIKVVDKLAELKARMEAFKAKLQGMRDKCDDEKHGRWDVKDVRDKIKGIVDDARDKGQHRDKDDKGARKR
jgi:hypothetical protein